MIDILFILQCAYYVDGKKRPYTVWEKRLWKSHTGRRLKNYIPDGVSYKVINSTFRSGVESSACFPPNLEYIKRKVEEFNPKVIVPCGKVAKEVVCELGLEYFPAPHPAWRQLSNEYIEKIRFEIYERI